MFCSLVYVVNTILYFQFGLAFPPLQLPNPPIRSLAATRLPNCCRAPLPATHALIPLPTSSPAHPLTTYGFAHLLPHMPNRPLAGHMAGHLLPCLSDHPLIAHSSTQCLITPLSGLGQWICLGVWGLRHFHVGGGGILAVGGGRPCQQGDGHYDMSLAAVLPVRGGGQCTVGAWVNGSVK